MFCFGIEFRDFYSLDGLKKIDDLFVNWLKKEDADLHSVLVSSRFENRSEFESEILIELSYHLQEFFSLIFQLGEPLNKIKLDYENHRDLVYKFKRNFIRRKVTNKLADFKDLRSNASEIRKSMVEIFGEIPNINVIAAKCIEMLQDEDANQIQLNCIARYCALMIELQDRDFVVPKIIDHDNLIDYEKSLDEYSGVISIQKPITRRRNDFSLSNKKVNLATGSDNMNYCIYCHKNNKDSCSKGLQDRNASYKVSKLGNTLQGCPLGQKISEMNLVGANGIIIGALAIIMTDNPLCPATGHHICNDCMKSCIYQKQDPVDIPAIETLILDQVLNLDYGFEIYSLLTRWNPLKPLGYLPKPPINSKVLVVGLGPAGFTLAYYLLQGGCTVVGIDGSKIEPLGIQHNLPIKDVSLIMEKLELRSAAGFGGVAEYGITPRWDKNYLKIIRIVLERNKMFRIFGGIRLCSNINPSDAFDLGFDHIALALGAGISKLPNVPEVMINGVRCATDFLMSLQLNNAFQEDSITNLQIRLPIVVIGGGLTSVDTATEALLYYGVQVKKFLKRYKVLKQLKLINFSSEEELKIVQEYLDHGNMILREEELAKSELREPRVGEILRKLGGATIIYHGKMVDSTAYKTNHTELDNALKEGVKLLENATLKKVVQDEHGHLLALEIVQNCEIKRIEARSLLIAIGTRQNSEVQEEIKNSCSSQYGICKEMAEYKPNSRISYFGDLDPKYSGTVVKAMASAKFGIRKIISQLEQISQQRHGYHGYADDTKNFLDKVEDYLDSTVLSVTKISPGIIEVLVQSKLAARNFKPGQFFKFHSFSCQKYPSKKFFSGGTESIALTGATVSKASGKISLVAIETGGSTNFIKYLQAGDKISLMGPTGEPTFIPAGETVLLAGGGLGNASLLSISEAMMDKGCEVLYFAGYKKPADVFKKKLIEQSSSVVVWSSESGKIESDRNTDLSFSGNILDAVENYAQLKHHIVLKNVDRILIIGSDRMMSAFSEALDIWKLKGYFASNVQAFGSINSPMQCMMKGICSQCLQRHVNKSTGTEYFVYSCMHQDQNLKFVDFGNLKMRLKQNSVQEKLTNAWIQYMGL